MFEVVCSYMYNVHVCIYSPLSPQRFCLCMLKYKLTCHGIHLTLYACMYYSVLCIAPWSSTLLTGLPSHYTYASVPAVHCTC